MDRVEREGEQETSERGEEEGGEGGGREKEGHSGRAPRICNAANITSQGHKHSQREGKVCDDGKQIIDGMASRAARREERG